MTSEYVVYDNEDKINSKSVIFDYTLHSQMCNDFA